MLVSKQQWDIKSPEIFICQLSGGLTFRKGGGGGHPDPEIRWGEAVSPQTIFQLFVLSLL